MPRDGSDVYSKAAGTTAVSGTTISSTKYNAAIDDIVNDLNLARPISVGGTGAATAAAARTSLGVDTAISDATTPIESDVTALQARALAGHPLIATVTASGDATVEFDQFDDSKYYGYIFRFHSVYSSVDLDEIYMRTSSDGGSTFDNGASDYNWAETTINDAAGSGDFGAAGTNVIHIGGNLKASNRDFNGEIKVHDPESTTSRTVFFGQFSYTRNLNFGGASVYGRRNSAAAVNAVRFFASSGNLSGVFTMHGIAK